MKKNVKRLLPILLVIIVFASICWYLFVYDRDFTRDMLVQSARFFEDQGNPTLAAWLYDCAYEQSNGDDAVAIELAAHFREQGNYTQAEITLSRAISEGGSVELYTALSQTFVEQNKLRDAVTMLDNIADPMIRQQINALRPAAPTATPDERHHNQFITVTLNSSGGTLYVSTDGSYPSVRSGASDGQLPLESGETVITALVVGDNGLVSTLETYTYTIINVIQEITLSDSAIEAAVRQALGRSSSDTLLSSDLWTLTELTLPEGAGDYSDLEKFPYLQQLTIEGGTAASLEGLQSLTSLQTLTIRNTNLRTADLLIISSLPRLQSLTLTNCGLSGIGNLSEADHLQYLDLSDNSIKDFSGLSFMTGLRYLDLSNNALTSLNAASALTGLQTLKVAGNSLTSITPITDCTQLQELDIQSNFITSLSGIEKLTALTSLNASENQLTDITPLASLTGLQNLSLSHNSLTDISCLSTHQSLKFFYFSYNQVVDLPAWSSDSALVIIDGSHNSISDISTLAGLENLNYVLMEENLISQVSQLAICPNLVKVNVYNNPVTDVTQLLYPEGLANGESTSITVIWNPIEQP